MPLNDRNRNAMIEDLDHFEIYFEAVLDHKPTYNCFKQFLHTTRNNDHVDDYKTTKSEKNRELKAKEILEKFIKDKSNYEINLKSDQKQFLLRELQEHYNFEKHLFDEIESSILYSLKESQFNTFLESDLFKQFIVKNTVNLLYEIGGLKVNSPIKLVENLADLKSDKFTIKDVKFIKMKLLSEVPNKINKEINKEITNKDISVKENKEIENENTDWELITNSRNYKLYFSKQLYNIGGCQGAQFWRQDMIINGYSSKEILNTLIELEYRCKGWDGNLSDIKQVHYYSINNNNEYRKKSISSSLVDSDDNNSKNGNNNSDSVSDNNKKNKKMMDKKDCNSSNSGSNNLEQQELKDDNRVLASTLIQETFHLGYFLNSREMTCTYTAIHDKQLNAYFICRKTCESSHFDNLSKKVKAAGIYGVMLKDLIVNDKNGKEQKACQFIQVVFCDFKGNVPRVLLSKIIKNRSKHIANNLKKFIELNEKRGFICENDLGVLQTMKENEEAGIEI